MIISINAIQVLSKAIQIKNRLVFKATTVAAHSLGKAARIQSAHLKSTANQSLLYDDCQRHFRNTRIKTAEPFEHTQTTILKLSIV